MDMPARENNPKGWAGGKEHPTWAGSCPLSRPGSRRSTWGSAHSLGSLQRLHRAAL